MYHFFSFGEEYVILHANLPLVNGRLQWTVNHHNWEEDYYWHRKQVACVWVEGGKTLDLIHVVLYQWEDSESPCIYQHYSRVPLQYFYVFSNQTESFTCPNYVRQSVVSLSLGYHLTTKFDTCWQILSVYFCNTYFGHKRLHTDIVEIGKLVKQMR